MRSAGLATIDRAIGIAASRHATDDARGQGCDVLVGRWRQSVVADRAIGTHEPHALGHERVELEVGIGERTCALDRGHRPGVTAGDAARSSRVCATSTPSSAERSPRTRATVIAARTCSPRQRSARSLPRPTGISCAAGSRRHARSMGRHSSCRRARRSPIGSGRVWARPTAVVIRIGRVLVIAEVEYWSGGSGDDQVVNDEDAASSRRWAPNLASA